MTNNRPPICDYEGSTYQHDFWEQGGRDYEDQAEALALRHLLPRGGGLLLELGAGAGRNTPRYAGFERVVLLDYSLTQLQQAQARLGVSDRYVYVAADAHRLPFAAGLFDAATMIRVIHHLADAPRALQQVAAVLGPGGVLVLEFANKRHLKSIARWLLRRQAWNPFDPATLEFAPLNFDFHPRAMLGWLRQAGLRPQQVRAVSYFRLGLLKRSLPTGWLVGLDGLLQPTGQIAALSPSVFVRAQAEANGARASAGAFFKCPECGSEDLERELELEGKTPSPGPNGFLKCRQCGRRWRVQEGVYDFREAIA